MFETMGKVDQIAQLRSLETVNRLVVITHDHQVRRITGLRSRQAVQDTELGQVGILEFVYHHVEIPLLEVKP